MNARLWSFVICSAGILFAAPFVGAHPLGFGDLTSDPVAQQIFWELRVPRVLLGFCAGAGLGMGGLVFQALFQNPLATPFTLGVASGSSLGAVLALWIGATWSFLGISAVNLAGLFGALLSISVVFWIARAIHAKQSVTMLLAGVAVSFFFSSLILFEQSISNASQTFQLIRWLMGGLEVVGYLPVLQVAPFLLIGTLLVFSCYRELDLFSFGTEFAASRGVDSTKSRPFLFVTISLLVGVIVSVAGPIGFVGIMIPHICRLLVGVNHRLLVPSVFMLSGSFLVLCDTVGRVVVAPAEIPVGVVCALLGGPFFLALLLQKRSGKGFSER